MVSGDVSSWVGVGITALALTGGCIAYIHATIGRSTDKTDEKLALVRESIHLATREVEARILDLKREVEADMTTERAERLAGDATERDERRREQDKLANAIDSFRQVSLVVTAMAEGLKHIGERFDSHRISNDAALTEIKESVRDLGNRIQTIPGVGTPARQQRRGAQS